MADRWAGRTVLCRSWLQFEAVELPGSGRSRRIRRWTGAGARDAVSFTGREQELARLVEALAPDAAGGATAGIHAIDGMAGIGKTTFAVHAAHRLAPGFPDGQLFLPLHAHTPGQRPVDPADALASLAVLRPAASARVISGPERKGTRGGQ